jgi:hypothetical protein
VCAAAAPPSPPPAIPGAAAPIQPDEATIKERVLSNTRPFPLLEELASLPLKQLRDITKAVMEADVLSKHSKATLIGMIIKGTVHLHSVIYFSPH